ncbi:MAG: hypothetical protein NTW29_01805 [Bacteroidetes bacterium]|nr:hypothetical protein [Bacteroidota bacterium]
MSKILNSKTRRSWGNQFLLVSILLSFNFFCTTKQQEVYKVIELYYKWDIYKPSENNIITFSDSVKIIESEEGLRLYQIPQPFDNVIVKIDTAGDIKSQRLINSGTRYSYLFCIRDQQKGILFNTKEVNHFKIVNADSLLSARISFRSEMFHTSNDSLLSVVKTGNIQTEIYIPRIKKEENYPDTSVLVFRDNKPGDTHYSLSTKLDSLRDMKLVNVLFVINSRPSGQAPPIFIPRREIEFSLRNANQTVSNEIRALFKKSHELLRNIQHP